MRELLQRHPTALVGLGHRRSRQVGGRGRQEILRREPALQQIGAVQRQQPVLDVALRAVGLEGDRLEAALIRCRPMTRLTLVGPDLGDLAEVDLVREVDAGIGLVPRTHGRKLRMLAEGRKLVARSAASIVNARERHRAAAVFRVARRAVGLLRVPDAPGRAERRVRDGIEAPRVERIVTALASQVGHRVRGLVTLRAARVDRRVRGRDTARRGEALRTAGKERHAHRQRKRRHRERQGHQPAARRGNEIPGGSRRRAGLDLSGRRRVRTHLGRHQKYHTAATWATIAASSSIAGGT